MRADPLTTTGDNFYDCRLDFLIQDTSLFMSGDATRELVIDHTTTTTSSGKTCGTSPYSIGQYLANNPNAVFGVGNGELYAFTLDTGSTGQDNKGLKVCSRTRQTFASVCDEIQSILTLLVFMYISLQTCWANVMITTTNTFGDTQVDGYAFDVL